MQKEEELPRRVLIFGQSGTGKSTLGVALASVYLDSKGPDAKVAIISPTAFSPINKPLFSSLESRTVMKAEALDSEAINWIKYQIKNPERKNHLMFFFDDMGDDRHRMIRTDNIFNTIGATAPHYNMSMFGLYQSAMQPVPRLRDNTDSAFMFKMPSPQQDNFIDMFMGDMGDGSDRSRLGQREIVRKALQNDHDYLEVDLRNPYSPRAFRNSSELLFPQVRLTPQITSGDPASVQRVLRHFLSKTVAVGEYHRRVGVKGTVRKVIPGTLKRKHERRKIKMQLERQTHNLKRGVKLRQRRRQRPLPAHGPRRRPPPPPRPGNLPRRPQPPPGPRRSKRLAARH